MDEQPTFDGVADRLRDIVDVVEASDISLDEALSLYEEAIKLGTQAADLCEEGIHGGE
jgi:exodeoxyribonuclease VII small subunit